MGRAGPSKIHRNPRAALLLAGAFVALLVIPAGDSTVALQLRGSSSVAGIGSWSPFSAASTSAGVGACTATMQGVVASTVPSARAVVYVNESTSCPGRTVFVLLPGLRFSNALPSLAGHRLVGSLTLVAAAGVTGMLRSVRFYLQQVGGGNPILSTTDAAIRRGAVTTASTSVNPLVTATSYGLGIQMTLLRPLVVSTARVSVMFAFPLDDTGVVRAEVEESAVVIFTY
jgi:hypothetical protein